MKSTPSRASTPLLAVAGAFAIVYVVWGSTYLVIKFAIETIPPFTMAGVRLVTAGIVLFALTRSKVQSPITGRQWLSAAVIGCLMLVGGNGLVTWAEQTVPSGQAALMIATTPLWFGSLDWLLFGGPRPTIAITVGIVIGLIGIYILIGPANIEGAPVDPKGGIALVLACFFWTLGSLQSKRADLPKSAFVTTAMEMLTGGAVLTIIGIAVGEWSRIDVGAISLKSWLSFAYLVLFGSIVALSAYVWLLQVSTPAKVSTYAYVNPVIAVFLGSLLGDEVLTPRVWVAVSIIIPAVLLITTSKRARAKTAEVGNEAEPVLATTLIRTCDELREDVEIAREDRSKQPDACCCGERG